MTKRRNTFFVAFTAHQEMAVGQIKIRQSGADDFRCPYAGCKKQFYNGLIAPRQVSPGAGALVQNRVNFGGC